MKWYLEVLKKYAVFSGRARRMEYWMFTLFNILISIALAVVDVLAGTMSAESLGLGLFGTVYSLAVLLPGLAVSVRRLHDIGRSGFWLFIILVPFVGAIVLFVFSVTEGDPQDNEYGANPKAQTAQ